MLRPARLGAATAAFALILALAPVAVASPRLLGLGVPLAVADTYTTPGHTTLLIAAPGVLANDIDVLGTNLTARLGSGPTHGNLTLATDGGFEYQPDGGFSGTDTFTYQAVEGLLQSLPATVSITVTARPSSTPGPTPTPTPTPAPTPKPTPSPTASPSPTLPLPTSLPLPTVPIPTLQIPALPVATPQESSFPGPSLGPTPAPPAASGVPASASPSSSPAPSGGLAVGAVSVPPGPGSGGPLGGDGGPTSGGLTSGGVDVAPDLLAVGPAAGAISTGSIADLGVGIEWIVPSVLVTLPGLLLIAVALAQLVGGFIWLPLTRRWLRGDGRAVATRGGQAPS